MIHSWERISKLVTKNSNNHGNDKYHNSGIKICIMGVQKKFLSLFGDTMPRMA
jgi:hypothetical protein